MLQDITILQSETKCRKFIDILSTLSLKFNGIPLNFWKQFNSVVPLRLASFVQPLRPRKEMDLFGRYDRPSWGHDSF